MMVRLTKLESESLKGHEISPAMRAVLGHVFVSMPWNYMDRYIDLVLENKINVEIGIGSRQSAKGSDRHQSVPPSGECVTSNADSPFMGLFGTCVPEASIRG